MEINKVELLEALRTVKPGLASKEMITQSTSFCFLDGKVVTYNDEISVQAPVKNLDITGAINADELYNFLIRVKNDEISISIEENSIIFKSGRSKAGLTLETEIQLPYEEIGTIQKWVAIPDDFLAGILFAAGACSTDMADPKLTCVHVNKKLIEGASNHRVANITMKKPLKIPAFLLPASTIRTVIEFSPVKISPGNSWVHFLNKDGATMSCRTFEDDYVNTSPHMQVDGVQIEFPKSLLKILERAGIFAKRDNAIDESITMVIKGTKLEVKASSASGWFTEKAKMVKYAGEDIEILFTPYVLKDILKQTTSAELDGKKLVFQGTNWRYLTLLRGVM